VPHDVRARPVVAGFTDVRLDELNTRRRMGSSLLPPSLDRMMHVVAWIEPRSRELDRVREVVDWTYRRLGRAQCHTSEDAPAILAGGWAWCDGYAVATVDPACNVVDDSLSIADLVAAPHLADRTLASTPQDSRFVERGYATYRSSFAYERAFDVGYHLPRPGRIAIDLVASASPRLGRAILDWRRAR
jgi:hypothetical protein